MPSNPERGQRAADENIVINEMMNWLKE